MNRFVLHLQSTTQYECIEGVRSFIGEDSSGHFGILAGHEPLLTTLVFGLCRYQVADSPWMYVALPGGVLSMVDNTLVINTRHYLRSTDFTAISQDLRDKLVVEEQQLATVKRSLHKLEEQMLQRLWEMRRQEVL